MKVIGYATHIVASCKLPADTVYTMTKTIADNTVYARARRQGYRRAEAEGDGRGHRRAVPPRRREVLQGSRHQRDDAADERCR